MTAPHAEGERDAIIIPFPLHRVTPAMSEPGRDDTPEAEVEETPGEGLEIPTDRQKRKAHNVALHALAGRSQSRAELENRLRSRELPAEVIEDEIASLEGVGYVDDSNLAAELVEKYGHRMGFGRRAVAEKLRSRHISTEIMEQALLALSDEDERESLRALAITKARSMQSLDPLVAKRRLVGALLRKGFKPSDVYEVVAEVLP